MNTKVQNLIARFEAAKTSQEEIVVFYEAANSLTDEETAYFDAKVDEIIDRHLASYEQNHLH